MKKLKKRYILSLAIILLISLSACKSEDASTVKADADSSQTQQASQDAKTSGEQTTQTEAAGDEKTSGEQAQTDAAADENGIPAFAQAYALSKTIQKDGDRDVVTNDEAIEVVVNKQRALPDGYIPPDLVEPNVDFSFSEKVEKRLMRKEAAEALEKLFDGAKADGIQLYAVSGYRSYTRQVQIFDNNVRTQGREKAMKFSAEPGKSEHQTGLAMDVSSKSAGFGLEQSFGDTAEGQWLAEHAAEYGFIIRYLQGKEDITGYAYEPWHVRYVGVEMAEAIAKRGSTLEEFLDDTGVTKS